MGGTALTDRRPGGGRRRPLRSIAVLHGVTVVSRSTSISPAVELGFRFRRSGVMHGRRQEPAVRYRLQEPMSREHRDRSCHSPE